MTNGLVKHITVEESSSLQWANWDEQLEDKVIISAAKQALIL